MEKHYKFKNFKEYWGEVEKHNPEKINKMTFMSFNEFKTHSERVWNEARKKGAKS